MRYGSEDWCAELPESWERRRLKYLATCNDEVLHGDTTADFEIEYVDIGSVNSLGQIERTETMTFAASPSRARRVVRDGDVLVSTVRTYLKAIAPVRNPPEKLVASTGFAVIRCRQAASQGFMGYALRAEGFLGNVISRSVGVSYPSINASDLVNFSLPAPPLKERTQIARFLDYETAKIDRLIDKQQQLIALLKEKRQAVISHAVTKGLNPNAPMKDSGVEWLGQVPAHWEAVRLRHLVESGGIQMGPFGTSLTDVSREPDEYLVYGQANTISGDFSHTSRWLSRFQYLPLAHYRLVPGDIVLTRKGSLGNCRVVPESIAPGVMDSDTIRVRVSAKRLMAEYLSVLMHDAEYIDTQIAFNRRGAILLGLNSSVVGNLLLCLPPILEQMELLKRVDDGVGRIDATIVKTEEAIGLLQERRTALISAAVTGKIDVRGWTPPDSDEESQQAA